MRKLGTIGVVVALCLLAAPGARAFPQETKELGDRCVGNETKVGWTATVLNNGLPFIELSPDVPPEGARVITRWRVQVGPGLGSFTQQLVAFKQVEVEEDRLVGESAVETLVEGNNEFATRVPVPEYAHIGLRGPDKTIYCDLATKHLAGVTTGPWALGELRNYAITMDIGVPVTAIAEPDSDADGYGDKTQDMCLEVPEVHGPCPLIGFKATPKVFKRAILLQLTTHDLTHLEISGQVSWSVPAKDGAPKRQVTVPLPGGTLDVASMTTGTFRVPLPNAVQRRLEKLRPGHGLKAGFAITSTDVAGQVHSHSVVVKLLGRQKAPRGDRKGRRRDGAA